jgi:hypothetical protein
MRGAHSWAWSAVLFAAAVGVPAGNADAQMPVPAQYRAEAERLDGPLPADPAPVADHRAERRAADSVAATTPEVTLVMEGTAELPRGAFRQQTFVVPTNSHCTLTGDSDGAGRDFEVLVMPSLDMLAWRADAEAGKPVWRSGPTRAATIDVSLSEPGVYDLVISNRAAWFLARSVKTKIQLSCTGDWPPS